MRSLKAVEILIPPDKSISHRAVILASISKGITCIKNLLMADDIKRTIEAFRAMGVSIFFERGPKGRVEKPTLSKVEGFSTRFVHSLRSVLPSVARSKNIVRAKRQRREVENNRDKHSFIIINGGKLLHGARVSSFGDHRTAMSMLVAGLLTKGKVIVTSLGCINKSFPDFVKQLDTLTMLKCQVVTN